MNRLIITAVLAIVMTSCVTTQSLYWWGGTSGDATKYESLAYQLYDKQTPKSICDLVATYEKMVSSPIGSRRMPPPGICAEYGYLLLQPETATVFTDYASYGQKRLFKTSNYEALFQERGKEMLQKEIEFYPESAVFILPLIKKLTE